MQKVCVIGLGYIGLPTASLLATKGFDVVGVDVNPKVVDTINRGEIHIYEPDLDILVKAAVQSGNLKASLTPVQADIFIIAVPTPFGEGNKPDLTYVEAASQSISKFVRPGNLVVLESTSPVGTTEKIGAWIHKHRPEMKFATRGSSDTSPDQVFFAHCPERVLPGNILKELIDNDRAVGGINPASAKVAAQFYGQFVNGVIVQTDSRTAELSKLTENAYRDVNIAFANELSMICDDLSVDVWELLKIANRHPRVKILQPGPGVGGHCIAVDPWFIVDSAPKRSKLIRSAREVNDEKPRYIVEKIVARAERIKEPVIACLGLSYKANIDDLRESPAIHIAQDLAKHGFRVLCVEPHITELPRELGGMKGVYLSKMEAAISEADIIVLLVDHKAFKTVDPGLLQEKIVFDTRGQWNR